MDKLTSWGRAIVCAGTLACLCACNHESASSSTAPASGTPSGSIPSSQSGNVAPQIAGAPGAEATVGQFYSFTPQATDADGDSLTFSVMSKPSWTSFDTSTGRLSGTPASSDVGSHEEISIAVSDGKSTMQLTQFTIDVVEQSSGSVSLAWQAPTENTDGSQLTNLSGYKIHYGTKSGDYDQSISVNNPGLTRYVVENLSEGTWYFAVSAVTASGVESTLSGEASKTM